VDVVGRAAWSESVFGHDDMMMAMLFIIQITNIIRIAVIMRTT
jgi:hypothetical protein